MTFDAVILAGGRARRLGGANKPELRVHGRRLLEHALAAADGARQIVVVAPDSVAVPSTVIRTLENPPHSGPVAAIGAGMAALAARGEPSDHVLLLACDTPAAASAVPRLREVLESTTNEDTDGAVLRDDSGQQWLIAMLRTATLRHRLVDLEPLAGKSMRELMENLRLASVPAIGTESHDVDTWKDFAEFSSERRNPQEL